MHVAVRKLVAVAILASLASESPHPLEGKDAVGVDRCLDVAPKVVVGAVIVFPELYLAVSPTILDSFSSNLGVPLWAHQEVTCAVHHLLKNRLLVLAVLTVCQF